MCEDLPKEKIKRQDIFRLPKVKRIEI